MYRTPQAMIFTVGYTAANEAVRRSRHLATGDSAVQLIHYERNVQRARRVSLSQYYKAA
jgi:hypothetical protein